jgi:hypothetical protein
MEISVNYKNGKRYGTGNNPNQYALIITPNHLPDPWGMIARRSVKIRANFVSSAYGKSNADSPIDWCEVEIPVRQAIETAVAILNICFSKTSENTLELEMNEYGLDYQIEKGINTEKLAKHLGTEEESVREEVIKPPYRYVRGDRDFQFPKSLTKMETQFNPQNSKVEPLLQSLSKLNSEEREAIYSYLQEIVKDIKDEIISNVIIPKDQVEAIRRRIK